MIENNGKGLNELKTKNSWMLFKTIDKFAHDFKQHPRIFGFEFV